MSQSPFYLEHYLDSLETLPGELRRNFTKMTDKDVMNKDIMVQIDGASDDYLRKVRDLSPTKRKAEMEKIQVRLVVGWIVGCYCGGDHTRTGDWAVKRAPRRESESTHISTQPPKTNISNCAAFSILFVIIFCWVSILQSSGAMRPLFLPPALC